MRNNECIAGIAISVVLVVVVGYLYSCSLANKDEREAEEAAQRAEAARVEQAMKAVVLEMVSDTNAIMDWETDLGWEVLTVELEKLWLQQRPILFTGSIRDIATHDQSQYVVTVEGDLFRRDLRLSLLSDKEIMKVFLQKHPDIFEGFGFNNRVSVVARIYSIKTAYISGEEGQQEVRIGDGELISILYTGDVFLNKDTLSAN